MKYQVKRHRFSKHFIAIWHCLMCNELFFANDEVFIFKNPKDNEDYRFHISCVENSGMIIKFDTPGGKIEFSVEEISSR